MAVRTVDFGLPIIDIGELKMVRNNMELSVWADGTVRLVYWDKGYGYDRAFKLSETGSVFENGKRIKNKKFIDELRKLAFEFKKEE